MMMGIQGDVIQTYIFFMNDIINCCIKMKEGKLYFILIIQIQGKRSDAWIDEEEKRMVNFFSGYINFLIKIIDRYKPKRWENVVFKLNRYKNAIDRCSSL